MPKFKNMDAAQRDNYLERKQRRVRKLAANPGQKKDYSDDLTAKQAKRINQRLNDRRDTRLAGMGLTSVKGFNRKQEASGLGRKRFIRKRRNLTARRAVRNDPTWASNPLTFGQAQDYARSLARNEFNPQINEINRGIRAVQGTHQGIDAGWNLYQQRLGQMAQQNAAQGQALMQSYGQLTGQQGPVQQGDVPGQAQQAARAQGQNFETLLGLQSQNQSAGVRGQGAVGDLSRRLDHESAQRRESTLREKRAELKRQRGRAVAENLLKIGDSEWQKVLEQAVFRSEIDQARSDARSDRAERRQEMREWRTEQRNQKADNRRADRQLQNTIDNTRADNERADREEKDEGKPKWTRTQRHGFRKSYNKGVSLARQSLDSPEYKGDKRKFTEDGQQKLATLTEKLGGEKLLAKAAIQTVLHGGVRPGLAKRIWKRYRIKVPVKYTIGF